MMHQEDTTITPIKLITITLLALVAFAANSVLSRMALMDDALDAASFTSIRLISGIVMLFLMMAFMTSSKPSKQNISSNSSDMQPSIGKGKNLSACMLFVYAVTFSYAYGYLDAGAGALILFGVVQITLFGAAIYKRIPVSLAEWVGVSIAFTGLAVLVYPTLNKPVLIGVILMAVSGVAWAGYTLMGAQSSHPLSDTAYNFLRTLPLIIVLLCVAGSQLSVSAYGAWLAVLSGALASGVGYTLWYAVLPSLPKSIAAVAQLLVPVIAALGGAIFTLEVITINLTIAIGLVSLGVGIVTWAKTRQLTKAI